MIIYTDDKKYASKILPGIKSWVPAKSDNTFLDNSVICKILQKKNIYFSEVQVNNNWKYLFITKHSDQSQFDLLYNLSKNNSNLPDGILCVADSGKKFHGYRNRKWQAQSGNLHLSLYKKPNQPVDNFHIGFTILAAVSVIQTLDSIPGMKNKAGTKWVNDILIEKAKISGVIAQTQSQQNIVTGVVLGIGLNIEKSPQISNDSFVGKSTCLYEHVDESEITFSDILFTLIDRLDFNYQLLLDGNYQHLLKIYKDKSVILNKQVEIYSDSLDGENLLLAAGKVLKIGDNLELYIEGMDNPIKNGRIKLLF